MPTRTEVLQGLRARDENQERDLNLLLDYIDQEAAATDAAARANILRRRNVHYTDRRDLRRIYNYIDILGAPVGTLRAFTRQVREYDQNSRRFINIILDQMDAGFYVGEYEAAVLADGANSFFKMQDNNPATWTDSGPDAVADMTEDGTGMVQVVGGGPFIGSNAFSDTLWGHTSALLDVGLTASQVSSFEMWLKPTIGAPGAIWQGTAGSGPRIQINGAGVITAQFFDGVSIGDPGAWVGSTLYAQGDRVRPTADNSRLYEAEVGGTSAVGEPTFPTLLDTVTDGADTAGTQAVDYGAAITGGGATGLANDATVYTGTVTIDGGSSQPISVVGSTAQTFTTLIAQLDLDTTGGTWGITGGDLVCTSDSTGDTSSVLITDVDVFSTTPAFVAILAAVQGLNTITWRDCRNRANFNDVSQTTGFGQGPTSGAQANAVWIHVVVVRTATQMELWIDAALIDTFVYPAADTELGTFGTPQQYTFATDFGAAASHQVGAEGLSNQYNGLMAYVATYAAAALTPAQIANHYAIAVGIGLQ